jgi:hypothetical protein
MEIKAKFGSGSGLGWSFLFWCDIANLRMLYGIYMLIYPLLFLEFRLSKFVESQKVNAPQKGFHSNMDSSSGNL